MGKKYRVLKQEKDGDLIAHNDIIELEEIEECKMVKLEDVLRVVRKFKNADFYWPGRNLLLIDIITAIEGMKK